MHRQREQLAPGAAEKKCGEQLSDKHWQTKSAEQLPGAIASTAES